jgi:hypothetical protein
MAEDLTLQLLNGSWGLLQHELSLEHAREEGGGTIVARRLTAVQRGSQSEGESEGEIESKSECESESENEGTSTSAV